MLGHAHLVETDVRQYHRFAPSDIRDRAHVECRTVVCSVFALHNNSGLILYTRASQNGGYLEIKGVLGLAACRNILVALSSSVWYEGDFVHTKQAHEV